jgi:hypothetical protein
MSTGRQHMRGWPRCGLALIHRGLAQRPLAPIAGACRAATRADRNDNRRTNLQYQMCHPLRLHHAVRLSRVLANEAGKAFSRPGGGFDPGTSRMNRPCSPTAKA